MNTLKFERVIVVLGFMIKTQKKLTCDIKKLSTQFNMWDYYTLTDV